MFRFDTINPITKTQSYKVVNDLFTTLDEAKVCALSQLFDTAKPEDMFEAMVDKADEVVAILTFDGGDAPPHSPNHRKHRPAEVQAEEWKRKGWACGLKPSIVKEGKGGRIINPAVWEAMRGAV